MTIGLILQSIIDGILIGGIYGLIAIGLTLIFGVMKIINFAQGTFMMLGMYVTYWSFTLAGINPYLTIPISAAVLFFVGFFVQKGVLARMTNAPEHNQLLVTLGIMLFLENLALAMWSPDSRSVKVEGMPSTIPLGSLYFSTPKLIAFVFAIILTVILYWFLRNTMTGKAIRATSLDRQGASLVGISTARISGIAFGLGTALSAVAGTLITPFFYASPTVGNVFILKAFIVVVLGGLGNFAGALVGGLIIGISESLGGALLPGNLKELISYVIFIIVLLLRPNGLFGGKAK